MKISQASKIKASEEALFYDKQNCSISVTKELVNLTSTTSSSNR